MENAIAPAGDLRADRAEADDAGGHVAEVPVLPVDVVDDARTRGETDAPRLAADGRPDAARLLEDVAVQVAREAESGIP